MLDFSTHVIMMLCYCYVRTVSNENYLDGRAGGTLTSRSNVCFVKVLNSTIFDNQKEKERFEMLTYLHNYELWLGKESWFKNVGNGKWSRFDVALFCLIKNYESSMNKCYLIQLLNKY